MYQNIFITTPILHRNLLILKLKGRSTNLPIQNFKIFSQKTGLRLVLPVTTKTGPGPQKTNKDQSWSVRSGLFGFWNKGEPVLVSVLHFWAKRPDRTRLTNTKYGQRKVLWDVQNYYSSSLGVRYSSSSVTCLRPALLPRVGSG